MPENTPLNPVPLTPIATPAAKAEEKPEALPQSGGSWTRDASGKLTQTVHPTRPPAPTGKVYAKPDDASDLSLIDAPKE